MGPSQTAIAGIELTLPFAAGPEALQPLLRLGAGVAERVRDRLAPIVARVQDERPERRALLDRYGPAIGIVTTNYTIEDDGGGHTARTNRALGFWWTAQTFCTTREALEPWRFDFAEAAVLQIGHGRIAPESVQMVLASRDRLASRQLDAFGVGRRLRKASERKLYTDVDGIPRTIRVLDREGESNVTCLHFGAASGSTPFPGNHASSPLLAAFAVEQQSLGLAWTESVPEGGHGLRLRVPLTHHAYGSPLVSSAGIAGIVVAPARALDITAIQRAAGRAVDIGDLARPSR
jgi:hypothetical protein